MKCGVTLIDFTYTQFFLHLPPYSSYSQELPSRCKKEIINAIHVNNDDHVDEDGLVRILQNIGAGGSILRSDLHNIFKELGDAQNHTISVSDLFKIL